METQYPLGIEDDNFWRDHLVKNLLNRYLHDRIIYYIEYAEGIRSLSLSYDKNPEAFFQIVNEALEKNWKLEGAIKRDYDKFRETSREMEKLMV